MKIARRRGRERALVMVVFLICLCFSAMKASAQWTKESYPLKSGWNGIWLSLDCSDRTMEDVLSSYPQIVEVWRWNPLASTVQFIDSPNMPIAPDAQWAVWRRGDVVNSTFGRLTGNASYLVRVEDGAPAFTVELIGKPLVPEYSFSSSGVNFIGFPAQSPDSSTDRNIERYFSMSDVLKSNPSVFAYRGGAMSSVNPKNPYQITTLRFTSVSRGKAYWVKSRQYTDYYGPLQVKVLGIGGIDFGRKLNTVTVRVKNVTDPTRNESVTAQFHLESSLPAPGSFQAAELIPLRVRGARDSSLQFTYQDFGTGNESIELTLAPGESKDLVLSVNRSAMAEPDRRYEGILQVTDSLGLTRIDLPVSGVGSSRQGIWVGTAVLNSVNRIEIVRSPEYDAALGTPDGTVPTETSLTEIKEVTANGVTTKIHSEEISFDADGFADLMEFGWNADQITLTSPADTDETPDFQQGVDYQVVSSNLAQISNPGTGYTEAPHERFEGGGCDTTAVATAKLSASVRRVKITNGGSGYVRQLLDVIFSGGGGVDAKGQITVENGVVTGVTIAQGGSGFTSAPNIEFPEPASEGRVATGDVVLSGDVVTGVNITDGGDGYITPLTVKFEGGGGQNAKGFPVVSDGGVITDIFITDGGKGYDSSPAVLFFGGSGVGVTAVSEIEGGIGDITITDTGSGYTVTPSVVIESINGQGAGAVAHVEIDETGHVRGIDQIQKLDVANGPIGEYAKVSYSEEAVAKPGTGDGTVVSTVYSSSKIITVNEKSRLVTEKISSGHDAKASSDFPIRLILHAGDNGDVSLLQQVYLGVRDGEPYAGVTQESVEQYVHLPDDPVSEDGRSLGVMGRVSSASFPLGGKWASLSGDWGTGRCEFSVLLGYNDSSNPFVHTYHPDHDNWDARYERVLGDKKESYTVHRKITLVFSPTPPPGISDQGWGVTTLGGFYTETFTGLRTQDITVSGQFILHQVSEVGTLSE
jgi:hypothetical protein